MLNIQNNEWSKAIALAFRMSAWLIGPIVLALLLGNWLDERYQSKPMWFLVVTGIAFVVTCFGLVREVRQYFKQIEKIEKKEEIKNGN